MINAGHQTTPTFAGRAISWLLEGTHDPAMSGVARRRKALRGLARVKHYGVVGISFGDHWRSQGIK